MKCFIDAIITQVPYVKLRTLLSSNYSQCPCTATVGLIRGYIWCMYTHAQSPHMHTVAKKVSPQVSLNKGQGVSWNADHLLSISGGLRAVLGSEVDVLSKDDCSEDKSAKVHVGTVDQSLFFWSNCHFFLRFN